MAVSRRVALLLGVPATALAVAAAIDYMSGDGPPPGTGPASPDLDIVSTNSGPTNRMRLIAALSNSSAHLVLAPGDYLIDNSGTDIVINNFSGELVMRPGARFVFTDNTKRGLVFEGGAGARFYGLTTAFTAAPTSRKDAQECVTFHYSTDTYVEKVSINGSAAAGLLFWQCVRPTVVNAKISNTMADGLHFANCQDPRADHVTTTDTGDDGVAFVDYAAGPANSGGLATNIIVIRSKSRGVAVVGQSGVTVRDARIDVTAGPGLYCAYEAAWKTRTPADVLFERARVSSGGVAVGGVGGNNSGLRVNGAGRVRVAAVTIDSPGQHGVSVADSTITLTDVTVTNTPGNGFSLRNSTCMLDRLTADGTNGLGFTATGCMRVEYSTLTLHNTAKTHSAHCAMNLENNAWVFGGRAWISDSRRTATGYVVRVYSCPRGNLGTIVDLVDAPDLLIDNPSALPYVRV